MAKKAEYEDDPSGVEALVSSGGPAGGADVLGDALMQLICGTVQLSILLAEADEQEFRCVAPRLRLLHDTVANLPERPCKRRSVGFAAPLSNASRRRKKRK